MSPPERAVARLDALLLPLFFLSGFSALLYQVVWQRLLAIISGVDVYSVMIIVAAFMLGIGCGNLAGGHLADRLPRRRLLLAFAAAELLIAGFALASKWLYYDLLYAAFPGLAASPVMQAAVLFLSLLLPTTLMGLTLPLLAKAVTRRTRDAARRIGALYALNTLGSAVGALVTAVVLVRQLGFERSLQVGAALNLCAALGALVLALRSTGRPESEAAGAAGEPEPAPTAAPPGGEQPSSLPLSAWLAIYALSGFIALGLEIVWFRLLGVILKSNAFTFGVLLCLYLVGVGAGTLIGMRFAPASRRPASRFFMLQAGITLYAGISVAALVRILGHPSLLTPVQAHLTRARAPVFPFALSDVSIEFTLLYALIAPLIVLPPTLLMGMSFPYLQRVSQTDLAALGRRVGWLQTANIAGATLGVVAVGALLLEHVGTPGALRTLIALGGLHLLLWWRLRAAQSARRTGYAVLAGAVALVMAAAPSSATLWPRLHGSRPGRTVHAEDATGVALIKLPGSGGSSTLFSNGIGQSSVPYGGIHTEIGLLSVALHPAPERVAIIGLGSGDTLFAAGGRPETRSLTSIEIIAPQLQTLRGLFVEWPYGGLHSILEDERIRYVFSDGRRVIMQGGERYDVIEADALQPVAAYSGNLYSEEYFTLLREHLEPGGLAVSWAPTPRTRRTFAKVFPHVAAFESILVGSESPIEFDREALLARMTRPEVRAYYARAELDPEVILRRLFEAYRAAPPTLDRANIRDTNSDLYPKDEFAVPE